MYILKNQQNTKGICFQCLSTGSKGNSYLLHYIDEEKEKVETLIIELGLPLEEIFKNLGDIKNVVGALYTHNHGDHNRNVGKGRKNNLLFSDYGIATYGSDNLEIGQKIKLGSFEITALPSTHDIPCLSFLIEVGKKVILFATDTSTLTRIKGCKVDTFIVEVNYSIELMNKLLEQQEEWSELDLQAQRSAERHLSLEYVENYFKSLSYKPNYILTIHASKRKWFDKYQVIERLKKYSKSTIVNVAERGEWYVL